MRKPALKKSFGNAFRGIFQMMKSERNFQIEIFALIVNVFLIVFLHLNQTDAAIILLTCFVVLSAEIFNTAVEKICDFMHPEFEERIKIIKDISAGAVLILAISALFIGILVYWKYF
jgi:diacylglycerol kinase (ATP)